MMMPQTALVVRYRRLLRTDLKMKTSMIITAGTIEHIAQLAAFREQGRLSEAARVELFDSIDCLNLDELSELYGIVEVGRWRTVTRYHAAVAEAKVRGFDTAEYLFDLGNLGTYLASGMAELKLD